MKILFICHRIPYPPNKGEKIRSFNILKYLSARHNVYLAFLVDDPRDLAHIDTLRSMAESLHYAVINPKRKKLQSSLSLFRSKPISVPYFYSASLQKSIDDLLSENELDCIFCSSSPTAEYVFRSRVLQEARGKTASPSPRFIMDFIDMDSYKWHQYAERAKGPMAVIYRHEARHLLDYEKRIATEFHELLLVSEAEKELFQQFIPNSSVRSLGNGVDLDFFHPGHISPLDKNGTALVFTGMMDYWPNVEGIAWFVERVFPRIQNKIPGIKLFIVGGQPSSKVRRLGREKGIVITGFVPDVRDYVAIADCCVIPLRIARGIQNKVLEAMAMGKAVVCSTQALEGIGVRPGEAVFSADNEIDFAEAVLALLANRAQAEQLGENARRFMEDKFTWSAQLSSLEAILLPPVVVGENGPSPV